MKSAMVLLVSTVVLLLGPALGKPFTPRINLNRIINLVSAMNSTSLPKDVQDTFVENLDFYPKSYTTCQDHFFCKVEKILKNHYPHFKEIVRNLEAYNSHYKIDCDKVQLRGESNGDSFQLQNLLDLLVSCCKDINFTGHSTSTP